MTLTRWRAGIVTVRYAAEHTQPDKVKELRALMDKIALTDRDAVAPKEP